MWQKGGNSCRGFTLIEILSALVLLGILAAVAIMRNPPGNASAIAEADALKAALRYAQARAMADVYTWGITITGSSYQLVEDNLHIEGAALPGESGDTHTLPVGVSITSGAGTTIRFDWRGQPVLNQITNPLTQTSAVDTNTKTITVTQSTGINITVSPYTGFIP